MKKFLLSIFVLFSINTFAITGTVVDVFCGEMDFGDACVIELNTTNNSKVAALFDFDDFLEVYPESMQSELIGRKIKFTGSKITDQDVIEAMDFLGDDITFYMVDVSNIQL